MFNLPKPALYGIAVILLSILFTSYGHLRYKAGQANVQAQFDSYKVAQLEEFAAQVKKVEEANAANAALNERITNELQPKLAAADARGRDLARRLSVAFAALTACRGAVPQAGGTGEPAGSSGIPGDGAALELALAEHLAACSHDALRLDGWIDWYKRLP